jgi:hypothetical protein
MSGSTTGAGGYLDVCPGQHGRVLVVQVDSADGASLRCGQVELAVNALVEPEMLDHVNLCGGVVHTPLTRLKAEHLTQPRSLRRRFELVGVQGEMTLPRTVLRRFNPTG